MRGCLDAVYKTTKDSNLLEIESKSSPASCSESSPGPGTRSKGKEELAEELRRQSWETRTVTMARVQKAETHRESCSVFLIGACMWRNHLEHLEGT